MLDCPKAVESNFAAIVSSFEESFVTKVILTKSGAKSLKKLEPKSTQQSDEKLKQSGMEMDVEKSNTRNKKFLVCLKEASKLKHSIFPFLIFGNKNVLKKGVMVHMWHKWKAKLLDKDKAMECVEIESIMNKQGCDENLKNKVYRDLKEDATIKDQKLEWLLN
ncbi:hypothetical protein L1987_57853 [Smallanthus sonchifolius]|uniref:Uncharacterized protein n=1 Tax=Smallanthus sonchifolius TaxID=185202 RepID=A0ACB9DEP2_9ASTR|nr:hypothetical protein L1987_57853 [Smallanthus sonchifolius]